MSDTPKNQPWNSGWRLIVFILFMAAIIKFLSVIGAMAAVVVYMWLHPRRGTWVAVAASVVAGITVGVAASIALRATVGDDLTKQAPARQAAAPPSTPTPTFDQSKDQSHGVSPDNPFRDPDYGKRSFTYEEAFPKK